MKNIATKCLTLLAVLTFFISCREDKSTKEKAEDAIEEVGDGVEEGAEEIEDEIDDATDDN